MTLLALLFACSRPPVAPAPCAPAAAGSFSPACDRDPAVQEGPGSTRIRLALSADGVAWEPQAATVAHQGGVPSCVTVDGVLHVFFVAWKDADGVVHDTTAHGRTADLEHWTFDRVVPDAIPGGFRDSLLDPTVLATGDGYTLLATQGSTGKQPARIFRYTSPDLDAWTLQPSDRPDGAFWADERKLLDSTAYATPDGYALIASGDLARGHFTARWAPPARAAEPGPRVTVADERGEPIKVTNCAGPVGDVRCAGYSHQPPHVLRALTLRDGRLVPAAELLTPERVPDSGGRLADPAICPHPSGQGEVMLFVSGYGP